MAISSSTKKNEFCFLRLYSDIVRNHLKSAKLCIVNNLSSKNNYHLFNYQPLIEDSSFWLDTHSIIRFLNF